MGGRKVPGLGGRGEGCKRWRLHKRFHSIFHGSLVDQKLHWHFSKSRLVGDIARQMKNLIN